MDYIFTQKELYWLDDILPGIKVDQTRRNTIVRHVRIPKISRKSQNKNVRIICFVFNRYLSNSKMSIIIQQFDKTNDQNLLEDNLANIAEVSLPYIIARNMLLLLLSLQSLICMNY